MKVFVVEPFGKGGIPQFAHLLSEGLSINGVDVTLLTGTDYELEHHPRTFEVRKVWKLWQRFNEQQTNQLSNSLLFANAQKLLSGIKIVFLWQREWLKFTWLILNERPNIIIFGTVFRYPLVWFYLNIIRFSGIQIAQVCHEFEMRETKRNPFAIAFKKLNDHAYGFFEAIFFLSNIQRREFVQTFENVSEERTHVIPMGNANVFLDHGGKSVVEMRTHYDIQSDVSVVLLFGRLTADKGISDLISAFAILTKKSVLANYILIIAGPSMDDIKEWQDQADALGIKDCVIIDARYIPAADVEPLMQMASVVVYPYWNASQSFSLQVAYSCGRPVVATRVGGLPEDVIEGKSGYVVDPHSPSQLADAIAKIISDPVIANEMGEYAHHLSITKHSWVSIGKQVSDVLQQL